MLVTPVPRRLRVAESYRRESAVQKPLEGSGLVFLIPPELPEAIWC
jgi:hypothetical protein